MTNTTKPMTSTDYLDDQLREKLATIEHERWADWQLWCHEVIRKNVGMIDELEDVLARWDRQAITPYDKLTEQEKASDMEQVDRYWPLIKEHIQEAERLAKYEALWPVHYAFTEIIKKYPTHKDLFMPMLESLSNDLEALSSEADSNG